MSVTQALFVSEDLHGRHVMGTQAYEEALRLGLRDQDDVEARFQYADLLHHWNPPRGRSVREAREPFAQVLEADPDFACPI